MMGEPIWLCIAGIVFAGAGIWGLIAGGYTVSTGGIRHRSSEPGEYEYHIAGRGIPGVFAVVGALIMVVFLLGHLTPPRIPMSVSDVICLILFVVGLTASVVLNMMHPELTTKTRIGPEGEATNVRHLSLKEAAKFMKMPEDQLLEMAKNGGIEARHVDGQYMFDEDILAVVRDSLSGVNN